MALQKWLATKNGESIRKKEPYWGRFGTKYSRMDQICVRQPLENLK